MFKQLLSYGKSQRLMGLIEALSQWLGSLLIMEPILLLSVRISSGTFPSWLLGLAGIHLGIVLALAVFAKHFVGKWSQAAGSELQLSFIRQLFTQRSMWSSQQLNDIIQNGIGTVKQATVFYDTIMPTLVEIGLTGLLAIMTTLIFNPLTLLIPFLGLVLIALGMMALNKNGNRKNLMYIRSFTSLGARFLDDLHALKTLTMYGQQNRSADKFATDSENFRKKTMGVLSYQLQTLTIMDFAIFTSIGCTICFQALAVRSGAISLGAAVSMAALTALWLISIRRFGYFIHVFHSLFPKLRRLFAPLKQPSQAGGQTLLKPVHSIKMTGAVGYPNAKPLVNAVNLQLNAGEVIGLVGASGSGKTTLVKTILGIEPPLKGTVTVNGIPLSQIMVQSWWQHISYLGPETTFFDGTIYDNLLVAGDNTDWQQELTSYGLCQFVGSLPAGWHTTVGENASRLSPGQKQQIALAREILSHKDVYLFDEISSSVDPDNAAIITRTIHQLAKTRIVMQVTHKIYDIQQLKQIHYIDRHQLVSGTYTELIHKNQSFAGLINQQAQLLKEVAAP